MRARPAPSLVAAAALAALAAVAGGRTAWLLVAKHAARGEVVAIHGGKPTVRFTDHRGRHVLWRAPAPALLGYDVGEQVTVRYAEGGADPELAGLPGLVLPPLALLAMAAGVAWLSRRQRSASTSAAGVGTSGGGSAAAP